MTAAANLTPHPQGCAKCVPCCGRSPVSPPVLLPFLAFGLTPARLASRLTGAGAFFKVGGFMVLRNLLLGRLAT
jgi:hypothetical protein